MSANAEIFSLPATEPTGNLDPAPGLGQAVAPDLLPPADPEQPRRNGKIPHLPQAQRDLINSSFDEGLTYQAVARKLAEQGVILNLKNLSDWFHGGYQDELKARERRALLIQSQERLLSLARKEDAPDLSFVGLQLAVTQLAQQLYDMAPGSHQASFQTDTQQYLRMLNSLARMSKAMLALQKHHDASAKTQIPQLAIKNPDRDLNDNEYGGIVNKMDQVFKVRRRRTPSTSPSAPKSDVGGSQPSSPATGSAAASPARTIPACAAVGPLPPAGEFATASSPRTIPAGESPPCNNATMQRCNDPRSPMPLTGHVAPKSNDGGSPTPSSVVLLTKEDHPPAAPTPVTRHLSPSPDRCHECGTLLPPLLSSGERPTPHCKKCGTALRAPGALIEYCPKCRHVLQELNANGTRPTPNCQHCNKPLPCPP